MAVSMAPALLPGGIYRMTWEDNLRWVLAVDDVQVIYDVWSAEEQAWGLRSSHPSSLFYKSFHHNFRELSEYVGFDALTEKEIELFGLALPMAVCRYRDFQWPSNPIQSQADFISYCDQHQWSLTKDIVLPVASVVLIPYDPVNGMGKGVVVHSNNLAGFDNSELLWHAHGVQQQAMHIVREGTGLHRQGWEQGFPSYYVGGYYDAAGYLKMQEALDWKLPT